MYANGFRYYFTPLPGYFSPFPHGTCPLSVTREYLGLAGGPARFTRDFSGPELLGIPLDSRCSFGYGGVTLYAGPFAWPSPTPSIFYCLSARQNGLKGPSTPVLQRLAPITQYRFGLFRFRSPLLTESRLLSLPVGTEMFHFPTFPLPALYIQAGVTRSPKGPGGVSPFGNPRITARLSAPRGLSQITTSFFGSRCQGIHRLLLET